MDMVRWNGLILIWVVVVWMRKPETQMPSNLKMNKEAQAGMFEPFLLNLLFSHSVKCLSITIVIL